MAERKDDRRDDDDDAPEPASKTASGGARLVKILLLVLALVVVGAGSAVGALYVAGAGPFATASDEDSEADGQSSAQPGKQDKKKGKKKGKDKGGQGDAPEAAVTYLALDPPFVVNLEKPTEARFLQVSMEVMARDPQAIENVKRHMPAIRHHLMLLLSSQTYETLASVQGKEKIRAEALAAVQKILQEHTGKPGVEAIYFTGFVMQ